MIHYITLVVVRDFNFALFEFIVRNDPFHHKIHIQHNHSPQINSISMLSVTKLMCYAHFFVLIQTLRILFGLYSKSGIYHPTCPKNWIAAGITHHLTHWGRVTHICVGKLTIIGSDNGLSPERRQAIIWTNAGIFFIRPLGTNFSEISIEINTFSFKKMHFKMSSGKWRPFVSALMC